MATSDDIIRQLESVNFPAAPEVVVRLSGLLMKEWVTGEQLAEVAMLDAGVSARVLRLANSVYFRGRGVKSIVEAVLRIGVDGVRDVVYALSLMRALRPMQFGYRPFWRHSLAVAQTAQNLQRRAANELPQFARIEELATRVAVIPLLAEEPVGAERLRGLVPVGVGAAVA